LNGMQIKELLGGSSFVCVKHKRPGPQRVARGDGRGCTGCKNPIRKIGLRVCMACNNFRDGCFPGFLFEASPAVSTSGRCRFMGAQRRRTRLADRGRLEALGDDRCRFGHRGGARSCSKSSTVVWRAIDAIRRVAVSRLEDGLPRFERGGSRSQENRGTGHAGAAEALRNFEAGNIFCITAAAQGCRKSLKRRLTCPGAAAFDFRGKGSQACSDHRARCKSFIGASPTTRGFPRIADWRGLVAARRSRETSRRRDESPSRLRIPATGWRPSFRLGKSYALLITTPRFNLFQTRQTGPA